MHRELTTYVLAATPERAIVAETYDNGFQLAEYADLLGSRNRWSCGGLTRPWPGGDLPAHRPDWHVAEYRVIDEVVI